MISMALVGHWREAAVARGALLRAEPALALLGIDTKRAAPDAGLSRDGGLRGDWSSQQPNAVDMKQ